LLPGSQPGRANMTTFWELEAIKERARAEVLRLRNDL
jgi:hypothetical protein